MNRDKCPRCHADEASHLICGELDRQEVFYEDNIIITILCNECGLKYHIFCEKCEIVVDEDELKKTKEEWDTLNNLFPENSKSI